MFSFAEIHPAGKMLLFFCMWIGRLEIVTALVLAGAGVLEEMRSQIDIQDQFVFNGKVG